MLFKFIRGGGRGEEGMIMWQALEPRHEIGEIPPTSAFRGCYSKRSIFSQSATPLSSNVDARQPGFGADVPLLAGAVQGAGPSYRLVGRKGLALGVKRGCGWLAGWKCLAR